MTNAWVLCGRHRAGALACPGASGWDPGERARDVGGPTVVVADDVASIRESYSAALSPAGFRVVGAAAVAQVRELDAAVLVLDVNLPDMTGEQILDRLRQSRPPRTYRC